MTLVSCPTDTVEAPVEIVWELLTDPAKWPSFYDMRLTRIDPPGPASPGQRIFGESGPRWLHLRVTITCRAIDAARLKMELEVQLPLGIAVKEELDCLRINDRQCRVDYHCHFELPSGWRGIFLKVILWRELRAGPADSLRRLKEAAEQRFNALDSSA